METALRQDCYFYPVFLIFLIILVLLGWFNAFIQDDAFISFRYAANLANGQGLVWNPDERVEGYTNFLWTLIMAVPHALGFGPVIFSKVLGVTLLGCSLVIVYLTAQILLNSRCAGLLAMLLLGSNYTFSAYATSGLETQLQAMLITLGFLISIHIIQNPTATLPRLLFSLAGGLGILTRLDSALPYTAMGIFIIASDIQQKNFSARNKLRWWFYLVIFAFALVAPWLAWKSAYYGSLLPNTFFVKAATPGADVFIQGVRYIALFMTSYLLIPSILAVIYFSRRLFRLRHLALAGALVTLWLSYVVYVGGDFMEFRFLVPILPIFFILISATAMQIYTNPLRAVLILVMLAGSLRHRATFENRDGIESIRALHAHVAAPQENWIGAGQRLKDLFGHLPDVRIATTAAGAIPYYSGMYSIDMLGLNDAWVARNGISLGSRPGHQRISPLSYLIERQVNLVIGQPMVLPRGIRPADHPAFRDLEIWELMDMDPTELNNDLLMLEIPLDNLYTLSVVYLQRHAGIDRVIQTEGLVTYPIRK